MKSPDEIRLVHVVGPTGNPICPKCGSKDVVQEGQWDWGPYWWECEECHEQWGHA